MLAWEDFLHVVHGSPLVSIDLIARRPDGAVLLGYRRNRPAQGFWFVPGGRILKGERMAEALVRILWRELVEAVPRGELEITDLNRVYLERGALEVQVMGRGHAWLDTGTHDSLIEAAQFIQTLEKRQGLKISCPEEIAWRQGWIDSDQLKKIATPLAKSGYGQYLLRIMDEQVF
jgi:hypothetical protein